MGQIRYYDVVPAQDRGWDVLVDGHEQGVHFSNIFAAAAAARAQARIEHDTSGAATGVRIQVHGELVTDLTHAGAEFFAAA